MTQSPLMDAVIKGLYRAFTNAAIDENTLEKS